MKLNSYMNCDPSSRQIQMNDQIPFFFFFLDNSGSLLAEATLNSLPLRSTIESMVFFDFSLSCKYKFTK